MPANQASSTPPTTAACSDQVMQDGAGRLWTSLGQSQGLQMAWRRLPAFRSDLERRSAVVSLIVVVPVRVERMSLRIASDGSGVRACQSGFVKPNEQEETVTMMERIEKMRVSDDALDLVFRKARTYNAWLPKPVPEELLRQLYDTLKWG